MYIHTINFLSVTESQCEEKQSTDKVSNTHTYIRIQYTYVRVYITKHFVVCTYVVHV